MVAQKLRKNGIPKRSGLQEGDRRASRALSLKLQVIDEYRMRQRQKVNGQCCAPLDETAKKFNVHKSLVSKWAAKEEELRCVVAQASATRFSLHPGSKCRFPLAEADTHAVYEKRRANGMRVTARFLRVAMRRSILERWRAGGCLISSKPSMASSVCTPAPFEPPPKDQLQAHAGRSKACQVQALARSLSASATVLINHAAPQDMGSVAPRRPNLH